MCANVKSHTQQYSVLLHCSVAVHEEPPHITAGTANCRCLASKQCCHPSTIATCRRSCVSVSKVCGSSRCTLTSSHGTDRTADVVHVGLNSHREDG